MTEFSMRIPEELRKKYLERRVRDLESLEQSMESGDLETFSRIGHQLKGNAATFGYETLAELGRKMEEAAEHKSKEEAKQCSFVLKAWIQEQVGVGESG